MTDATLSLRHDDPQLRHLDHAWSTTVHGAQGSTADGVIAVLDSGHGSLTDQSTFYVEISRARDSAVVLTDNREQLVEVLEAHTGERATALEAVGEEIDPEVLRRRHCGEGAGLDAARGVDPSGGGGACGEGTVAFLAEGYGALVGRTDKLANWPNLPGAVREVVDGLLAYDRACREGDALAHEFLGLLEAHEEGRRALEDRAAAEGAAAAGMEAWAEWRAMAERLAKNGRLVLEALGRARRRGGGADRRMSGPVRCPAASRRYRPAASRRFTAGGGRTRPLSQYDPVLRRTAMTNFWSWPARSPRRRSRRPPSWRLSISSSPGRKRARRAGRRSRR